MVFLPVLGRLCSYPPHHEELTADLRTMFQQAIGILSTEKQREFHRLQGAAFSRIPERTAPVETIASIVLHKLVDTINQMGVDQTLEWIPWEKLNSRASEITHTQKDFKRSFDHSGNVKVAQKHVLIW